jgi:hypothetical protein
VFSGAGEIGTYDYGNAAWIPLHINASGIIMGDSNRGGANVSIGTTSLSYPLTVSSTAVNLKLQLTGGGVNNQNGMGFDATGGGDAFYLYSYASGFGIFDNTTSAQRLTILNNGTIGIGTPSPRGGSTLDVNGKLYVATFAAGSSTTVCQNGNVLSSCTSALRFKENIKPYEMGLKEVLEMKPVTFDQRDHTDSWEKHDFGFVAEEMKKINPIFVTYDEKGTINGVRYMQLTAVNTRAIQEMHQEMQAEIDDLKRTIEELKHQQ